MANLSTGLDQTFRALADPTRRAVVAALGRGPASVSDLAKPFTMALPTFLQHLRVLEDSGLIATNKVGRVRTCTLEKKPLAQAEHWLEEQKTLWTKRLDQLDAFVLRLKDRGKRPMTTNLPTFSFDPMLDLELARVVDVPPRLLWRAWTEPELLMQWFCPLPWKTTACEIDLRPGGRFRTVMEGPNGERHDNVGCFLAVVPETLLVFTDALGPGWRPTGSAFMTATVGFEPDGSGTRYVARAFHKDDATRKQHEEMGFHQGWATTLDQLVALVKAL